MLVVVVPCVVVSFCSTMVLLGVAAPKPQQHPRVGSSSQKRLRCYCSLLVILLIVCCVAVQVFTSLTLLIAPDHNDNDVIMARNNGNHNHNKPAKQDEITTATAAAAAAFSVGEDESSRTKERAPFLFYQYHSQETKRLVNSSTILNWDTHGKPDAFRPLFQHFHSEMNLQGKLRAQRRFRSGELCNTARHSSPSSTTTTPHVLFLTPFHENWGALSTHIPNRTANLGNWTRDWQQRHCVWTDVVTNYLNLNTTRGVIAVQFQAVDHPKIHSIPLGIAAHQVQEILTQIHHLSSSSKFSIPDQDNPNHENHHPHYDQRPQLLMINSQPRPMRTFVIQQVIETFAHYNVSVANTFETKNSIQARQRYYTELKRSKFILSPSGMGLDCYRHWEALYLGTIPILERLGRKDGWIRAFQDLPVAWIDSYDHLTPLWLEDEYQRLTANYAMYKYEKLTIPYWIQWIQSMVA